MVRRAPTPDSASGVFRFGASSICWRRRAVANGRSVTPLPPRGVELVSQAALMLTAVGFAGVLYARGLHVAPTRVCPVQPGPKFAAVHSCKRRFPRRFPTGVRRLARLQPGRRCAWPCCQGGCRAKLGAKFGNQERPHVLQFPPFHRPRHQRQWSPPASLSPRWRACAS